VDRLLVCKVFLRVFERRGREGCVENAEEDKENTKKNIKREIPKN
jgi:hypothetical protein